MTYIKQQPAHTRHTVLTANGTSTSRYSRHEAGVIDGQHRQMSAIVADVSGFDGLGFDPSVGSSDDHWHVLNVFKDNGVYIDSVAVCGAMDGAHAMQIAGTQFDSLGGSYCTLVGGHAIQLDEINDQSSTWSIDAISKLMNNPSQNMPFMPIITASELAAEAARVTINPVIWGDDAEILSHDGSDQKLFLDMIRTDTGNELTADLVLANELFDLDAEDMQFDALMDTNNRLSLLKDRMYAAMSRSSVGDLAVTSVTQTKPFKRQGVSNVAFVFDLSDGQKVSIWFHNPDNTPTKLLPSDIMISWKWMLNKRDVTALLSPKNGDDVQLGVLAKRIMRVAVKNSARFKRTQAAKIKLDQEFLEAEKLVESKTATIAQLDSDIKDIQAKIDSAIKAPTTDEVAANAESAAAVAGAPPIDTDELLAIAEADKNQVGGENDTTAIKNAKLQITEINQFYDANGYEPTMDGEGVAQKTMARLLAEFRANKTLREILKPLDSNNLLEIQPVQDGKYPPVEYLGGGVYQAFKNQTKKDGWQAYQGASGEWLVSADNAQTRAYRSSRPKYFKNVQAIIDNYPAFKGLDDLIATVGDQTNITDGNNDKTMSDSNDVYLVFIDQDDNTATYSEVMASQELIDSNGRDVNALLEERAEHVTDLLIQSKGWVKVSPKWETEGAGITKNGHILVYTLGKADDANGVKYGTYHDLSLTWKMKTTNFEYRDMIELTDSQLAAKIDAEAEKDLDYPAIADEDDFIDMFLDRNAGRYFQLGFDDQDIEPNDKGIYHVLDSGVFSGKSVRYVDTVMKLNGAANDLGATIAISDFNATVYQDSLFDSLSASSSPVYGVTAQIGKDGYTVRASVDEKGDCEILRGASGEDVFTPITNAPTDNTRAYKKALDEAFTAMTKKDIEDSIEADAVNDAQTPDAPANSPMAERIDALLTEVASPDYDPSMLDSDELIDLSERAENDSELMAKIETISKIYEEKIIKISLDAINNLSGGA